MRPRLPSALVVEENSNFMGLMETILEDEIDLVKARCPEEGTDLIKNSDPFSVIWSGYAFKSSKVNGRNFLNSCCEYSPLSARILNAYSLKESELQSMVNKGEIHSYNHHDQVSVVVEPISSAIEIGVEYYHTNLIKKFIELDDSHMEPQAFVKESSQLLNQLETLPVRKKSFDFESRSLELEKLSNYQNFLLGKTLIAQKRQKDLLGQINTKQRIENIEQKVERNIALILNQEKYLINTKQLIKQNIEKIRKTNAHVYRVRKLIKELKDEFGDDG